MAIVFPVHNTAAFDYHDGYIVKVEEREIPNLGFEYKLTIYQPGFESSRSVNSRDRRGLQDVAGEIHTEILDKEGSKFNGPLHTIKVVYL